MKFSAQTISTNIPNCKMRTGQITELNRLQNAVLMTPLLLMYTKGGSVCHLTREVLEMVTNLSSLTLQIPMASSAQCYNAMKHFKEGLSNFVGLPECLSYCTVQDPAVETKTGYNEKSCTTIWTNKGRQQLTADKYMDMIEAFRPDMYHALCDGDTNQESSRKRAMKAVDVSTRMFLTCAERHAKSQSLKQSALLAVLEGGYDLQARQEAVKTVSNHPLVEGFVIDGLHNNGETVENIEFNTIEPVIKETLTYIPEDKLRVIHGGWRPDVVLELVKAGVDVFDSSLVYTTTEQGLAFSFTYKPLTSQDCNEVPKTNGVVDTNDITNGYCHKEETKNLVEETKSLKNNFKSINNYKMDLKDKIYFDDLRPILEDCKCLACTKHTRSYIHHLLNTREMLASVLLVIHNLHHYNKFFTAIRENGKKGQLLTIDPPLS